MPAYIVIGAQWGDEGKGKIVDYLAGEMDLVLRFQGGANAGHTVIHGNKKFVTHLLPSGLISGAPLNMIANGCVVCPFTLLEEIESLQKQGIRIHSGNFLISSAAHIVLPVHKYLDKCLNEKIGTTVRGIGPAYTDKVSRNGIRWERVADGSFEHAYKEHLDYVEKVFAVVDKNEIASLHAKLPQLMQTLEKLKPFVRDARPLLNEAVLDNKKILFEGAQGTFLDIDQGTYPFVTSSNTSIGGAFSGSGMFLDFDKRIGIVKSYTTRVGEGPFPTELFDATGEMLRKNGNEYGATTGRPRRCGWLDLKQLQLSCQINGFNYLVLSKISCLSGLGTLKVALDYEDGNKILYKEFPGWDENVEGCRDFDALPKNCQNYIHFIEDYLRVPIGLVSTGPDRRHVILRKPLI